jgi:hypothetical protein
METQSKVSTPGSERLSFGTLGDQGGPARDSMSATDRYPLPKSLPSKSKPVGASGPQKERGLRSTMRGVPAIAANPREGSRLLWFWVKVPNSNSEIGTTRLARARACGISPSGEIAAMTERSDTEVFLEPPGHRTAPAARGRARGLCRFRSWHLGL